MGKFDNANPSHRSRTGAVPPPALAPVATPPADVPDATTAAREAARARHAITDEEERDLLRRIRQRLTDASLEAGLSPGDTAALRALALSIARDAMQGRQIHAAQQQRLIAEVLSYISGGLGPLQPLFADAETEEIEVNRWDEVWRYGGGRHERTDVRFRDDDEVVALVQRLAGDIGRQFNLASPILDGRLADGSRINAILRGLSVRGTVLTVRRKTQAPDWADLQRRRMFPGPEERLGLFGSGEAGEYDAAMPVDSFLHICVLRRVNIVVIGGTSTGKTTVIGALLGLVPRDQRVIYIEDVAELPEVVPNLVRLEVRRPNSEGVGEIDQQALLVNTLRMRPDRIVVGEVRGAEAGPMVEAMTTEHPGSMTSLHASSPTDALLRLEGLYRSTMGFDADYARARIARAVQLIVQIGRDGLREGFRAVREVAAVDGYEPGGGYRVTPLYAWADGYFRPTGNRPAWAPLLGGGVLA